MTKGKATGRDRDYQVLGLGIIQTIRRTRRNQDLQTPPGTDGIDVPYEVGGTAWSFDVALTSGTNREPRLVAECKRWACKVQDQDHIAAFAWRVHLLRKRYGPDIEAVYVAKSLPPTPRGTSRTPYRLGAIRAAAFARIELAELAEDQTPDSFRVEWHFLNSDGDKTQLTEVMRPARGSIGARGTSTGMKGPARTIETS